MLGCFVCGQGEKEALWAQFMHGVVMLLEKTSCRCLVSCDGLDLGSRDSCGLNI